MSYYFDGVDDYLYTNDTPSEMNTLPITMMFWGKLDDPLTLVEKAGFSVSPNNTTNFVLLGVNSGGYARGGVRMGSSTSYNANSGILIADSGWHNYIYQVDSDVSQAFYFDGANEGLQTADAGTFTGLFTRLSIGALLRVTASVFFRGHIAHATAWNVKLTTAEIAKLGAGENPQMIRPASRVFYKSLLDESHGLTVVGAPVFSANNNPPVYPIGPAAKQYANGNFQSASFVQVATGPMKVCANAQVHVNEMVEVASGPSKLYANGTHACTQFVEQVAT